MRGQRHRLHPFFQLRVGTPQRLAGFAKAPPEMLRILFRLAGRPGLIGLHRLPRPRHQLTTGIEQQRPGALRALVESQQQWRAHDASANLPGTP